MAPTASPGRAGRLITFALILVGLFGTAYSMGELLPGHAHTDGAAATGDTAADHDHSHSDMEMSTTLHPASAISGMYELEEVSVEGSTHDFRIVHHGGPVTSYDFVHGALLHVVVVRPDLSDFHHVHPEIADDGTFAVTPPAPGPWHVVFEGTPSGSDGTAIVVSADLDDGTVVETVPLPPPPADGRATGVDPAIVATLRVDTEGLAVDLTDDSGQPLTGLEPYLEQAAHLVVLRAADLAYVHLHPTSAIGEPTITFAGKLPDGATYRAFLQFGWNGEVITIPITIET